MENFKIDAAIVISHPEQITVVAVGVYIAAGEAVLFVYPGGGFAVLLKVEPEKSPAQPQIEALKSGQHYIQCLLQKMGVDLFFKCCADAVDAGHILTGDDGKKMGGVVQLLPAYVPALARGSFGFILFAHRSSLSK